MDKSLESIEISEKVKNPYEEYLGVESDDDKKLDYVKTFRDNETQEEFKYRKYKWLESREKDD